MPLCCSNHELAGELARRLMEKMEGADPANIIPVGQGDGFQGCECDVCRKLVSDEGSEAAPMILMLNRALAETTKRYPEHKLITFAYFETLKAPKTIRPHKNLWINIVSSSLSLNQAGDQFNGIEESPANREYAQACRDWPKAAPGRVTIWH